MKTKVLSHFSLVSILLFIVILLIFIRDINASEQKNNSVDTIEYVLYRETNMGNKLYVKVVNGYMTGDGYTLRPEGKISTEINRISDSDVFPDPSSAITYVQKMNENTEEIIDLYEKVDGQIRLLRVENSIVTTEGGYKYLDMKITDLISGEELSYDQIIESRN